MNIFISYSRTNAHVVRRVVELLKSSGHNPWIDTEALQGGSRWRKEIAEAIKAADIFLLVLSSHAVGSPEVHRETNLAGDIELRILPVLVERGTVISSEMNLLLAGIHWINLVDDFDGGARSLLQALGEIHRVGPKNYMWGVDPKDVRLLHSILNDTSASTADRLTRFGLFVNDLYGKAQDKINERLRVHYAKYTQYLEASQRAADQSRKLQTELSHLKIVAPESEACRLIETELIKSLREEIRISTEAPPASEAEELYREMKALRESRKPFDELFAEIGRVEREVLDRFNRA